MELYARTELDTHSPKDTFAMEGAFLVIRRGWFSYAFLLDDEERTYPCRPHNWAKAMQFVDSITTLSE